MTIRQLVQKYGSEDNAAMAVALEMEPHLDGIMFFEWSDRFWLHVLFCQNRILLRGGSPSDWVNTVRERMPK